MRILRFGILRVLKRTSGLREKSESVLITENGRRVLAIAASYNLDELLAGISPANLHEETDWGPAVGNEVW